MKLPWLIPALEADGPYLSVYLDTTRTDQRAADELATRWAQQRGTLRGAGAPDVLLAEVEETVLAPTRIGGRHGRAVLATEGGIVLDRVLPAPPLQECAAWSDRPVLLPLLQLTPYAVSQLLIEVDRSGADLHLRAPENPSIPQSENVLDGEAQVDGGHDELHKTGRGGGSQHGWRSDNFEARVEDSWERNAEAVAQSVQRLVARHRPEMVLATGDVRALSLLKDELGPDVLPLLREIPGGTRGQSLDRPTFRESVREATREHIDARQRELADRFAEEQGRGGTSVAGVDEVRQALERGQVEELIFVTGQEPAGIEELLAAAIRTDAGVSALADGVATVPEGVGALLRWRDGATPSNSVGSMTGDSRREHGAV
ncbi:Vms1/Ankzf1 family peptidyl-tRNA hydrolase [Brachybacterium phenoliresistens]|uniref:baeRF2 domain-containing protein n=1 Tax=Brachybacterium phenoliresistens TaxID=396014 RepID=UPI0031D0140D